MKKLVILFYLTGVSWPAFSQNMEADKKALRYLKETEWPKAYREQDTVLLNRILADEFQLIDAEGTVTTKKDELDYIRKNKPRYTSFDFRITRLDVFENETAVVSGTGTLKGTDKNGGWELTYQSSNVFIKRKKQWQAIASHVSGVKRK